MTPLIMLIINSTLVLCSDVHVIAIN